MEREELRALKYAVSDLYDQRRQIKRQLDVIDLAIKAADDIYFAAKEEYYGSV